MQDIDSCCNKAGLWPDVMLSGHAHLYQRFTRTVNGRQVPYIVSGSGGFAATAPQQGAPPAGTKIGDHILEVEPIVQFGYLTITTDAKTLTATFKTGPRGGPVTPKDSVRLDLVSGTTTASGVANMGGRAPHGPRRGRPQRKRQSGQTKR